MEPYIYRGGERGADVAEHFVNYLIQIIETIKQIYDRNEIIHFDEVNADSWQRADRCYLCDKPF
jgi:PP-loop superfamily ATP-utilizing enzyme